MDDIRAVLNDHGLVVYRNVATEEDALADLLTELGGVPGLPAPDRILRHFGNGLTKDRARTILKRRRVPFDESQRG